MQLMMYLDNDLIEAVALDREKVSIPGYLGNIKRRLKEKYHVTIQESGSNPEFLVVRLQQKSQPGLAKE